MNSPLLNVLFLCTGNSARSIMAEALLERRGRGKFKAYSAGSLPTGQVHPLALEILMAKDLYSKELRSKSWHEFAGDDAPKMDFIFTVCDRAANEACPVWPGQAMSAHWGIEDPDQSELSRNQQLELFQSAFRKLDKRIRFFCSLPFDKLDRTALQNRLNDIGKTACKTAVNYEL